MAKINTQRPGAVQYNGMTAKFIRDVVDGPAFNDKEDQTIVEIDGVELYFYASEVELTEDENGQAEKQAEEYKEKKAKADAAATKSNSSKEEAFAATKRGAKHDAPKPQEPKLQAQETGSAGAHERGEFVPPPQRQDQAQNQATAQERPFAEQNLSNQTPGHTVLPKQPQQPDAPNDPTPPFAPRNA